MTTLRDACKDILADAERQVALARSETDLWYYRGKAAALHDALGIASQPSPDLATLLKDDVRALAHLTREQWAGRRGGDPIARTINAVFDIIDARLAAPAAAKPEKERS